MTKQRPEIWVFGDLDDEVRGDTHWEKLDPETLQNSIAEFATAVLPTLNPLKAISDDYSVSEIELSLTVSATGKVGFLGTGAEVAGGATIKIKLKAT